MSQPHNQHRQSGVEPSRNVFVRFQQGFERGFNRFRERYGLLLEQVIAMIVANTIATARTGELRNQFVARVQ